MLSNEVRDRIREAVALGGKVLEPQLVPNHAHPVRNPYAHLWREIKKEMGKSYLECDDADEKKIIEVINHYVNNPCF